VHRGGVAYNNTNVQQRFGNNKVRSGSQQRMDFRGRTGEQVLQPGAGRGNLGQQANIGDRGGRPNVGGGTPGNRPNIGGAAPGTRPNVGGGANLGGQADRGNRPNAGGGTPGNRPNIGGGAPGTRPNVGGGAAGGASRPGRESAFGNIQSGQMANRDAARGRASLGAGSPAGGGMRGGGGGGRGGGGRRSDIRLKHDVTLLGRLGDGLGFYRFSYNGSDKAYVGVIAQEVQKVMPEAVVRGRDGYLRVYYDRLGLRFETYDQWVASGAWVPRSRIERAVDVRGDRGVRMSLNTRDQTN
jgi:hypothetical protein